MQLTSIPGYGTGTWVIDPVHSDISFTVKHLGISKVRGNFAQFEGTLVTAEDPLKSSVTATIQTASVETRNDQRDGHVRGEDFLAVEKYPTMTFTSTGLRAEDEETILLDGELTLCGVTKSVTLTVEIGGFGEGFDGVKAAGFSARTEINRQDFGITGGPAGSVVGNKIQIALEIEATLQA